MYTITQYRVNLHNYWPDLPKIQSLKHVMKTVLWCATSLAALQPFFHTQNAVIVDSANMMLFRSCIYCLPVLSVKGLLEG